MFSSNYRYLISFTYSTQGILGFGNAEVIRKNKISSLADLEEWSRSHEKAISLPEKSLVVISFQVF